MSTTLTDGTQTVTLPETWQWSDEDWAPIEQSTTRSITGAAIVQIGQRAGGRPITLQPIADDDAGMSHAVLTQLRAWAAVPGQQLVLTLRGTAYTVLLRHEDGAIESRPFRPYEDVQAADPYLATLRFITV